ncbi:hypothetical protein EVAR_52161_1 [Eumeta japonica]|uniref:Uncharacterized protein n=1 Tax=Eumeta variegata TaxID=151549 RepID=A0A4C1YCJ1_EUMVA|nr:hypothetical protein EVAR_52161_1 [Eumeta japonica]
MPHLALPWVRPSTTGPTGLARRPDVEFLYNTVLLAQPFVISERRSRLITFASPAPRGAPRPAPGPAPLISPPDPTWCSLPQPLARLFSNNSFISVQVKLLITLVRVVGDRSLVRRDGRAPGPLGAPRDLYTRLLSEEIISVSRCYSPSAARARAGTPRPAATTPSRVKLSKTECGCRNFCVSGNKQRRRRTSSAHVQGGTEQNNLIVSRIRRLLTKEIEIGPHFLPEGSALPTRTCATHPPAPARARARAGPRPRLTSDRCDSDGGDLPQLSSKSKSCTMPTALFADISVAYQESDHVIHCLVGHWRKIFTEISDPYSPMSHSIFMNVDT